MKSWRISHRNAFQTITLLEIRKEAGYIPVVLLRREMGIHLNMIN